MEEQHWFDAAVRTTEAATEYSDHTGQQLERLGAVYFWRGVASAVAARAKRDEGGGGQAHGPSHRSCGGARRSDSTPPSQETA